MVAVLVSADSPISTLEACQLARIVPIGPRADPDLGLDIADLGAAYLGGTKLASLARAERVTELSPGAVLRADRMLACNPPPISTTHF